MASVREAAVVAFTAFPMPGIRPTVSWERLRPAIALAQLPKMELAADLVSFILNTPPRLINMPIWIGVIKIESLNGILGTAPILPQATAAP